MSRRSPRKKAITPVTIIDSDDDFMAVASDDPYVTSCFYFVVTQKDFSLIYIYSLDKDVVDLEHTDKSESHQDSNRKQNSKLAEKHGASVRKNSAATRAAESDDASEDL